MGELAALLAVLYSVILAASAVGKLGSSDRGRNSVTALRLRLPAPARWAGAVIVIETALAVGLVGSSDWQLVFAATCTLLLFIGLTVLVARAKRLGSDDECGCFGRWMPSRVGSRLLARNCALTVGALVLAAATVLSVVQGEHTGIPAQLVSLLSGDYTWLRSLSACVLCAATVWFLVRSVDPASGRTDGDAPSGSTVALDPVKNEIVDVLSPGPRARLLVFISPGCHACWTVTTRLKREHRGLTRIADVFTLAPGGAGHVNANTQETLIDVGDALSRGLGIGNARPVAVLVATTGDVVRPFALGTQEIDELLDVLLDVAE